MEHGSPPPLPVARPPSQNTLEIRSQHQSLSRLFRAIEEKTWRCARQPSEQATAEVLLLVEELEIQLPAHFEFEEAGGYLAEELTIAPRLSNRAMGLRRDHDRFLSRLTGFAARVRQVDGSNRGWRVLASESRSFTHAIRNHELAENRLIQDALFEDLGGGG